MKIINLNTDSVKPTWFPATQPANDFSLPQLRILMDSYKIFYKDVSFTIKKGTLTDLASVPRFLWAFFPPYGIDDLAFIVHDHMYRNKILSKKDADECMKLIQQKLGVSKIRYKPMYLAVKWFGPKWDKKCAVRDKK